MKKQRVLIVDDSPFILRMLTFLLRKEGIDVLAATNGVEALETMRAHHPDLVFLDVMMPEMDGFDVLQNMKRDEALKDIPVIMITAKGQETDRRRAEQLGVDDFITKPFSPSTLSRILRGLLAAQPGRE
jgi:CheY-like chemotaxis protein